MPILTPGVQDDGDFRLVRADNHAIEIVGTAETLCACYPIKVAPDGAGGFEWEYTGGESSIYDETSEVETNDTGEALFQDEDGNNVPASQVAILNREDEEVGRLGAEPEPVATGRNILALPYNLERDTDDASILASLGRWIDAQPAPVARSIAAHFRREATQRQTKEA